MKTKLIKYLALGILTLASVFGFGFGCSSSKPMPDPLAGFHTSSLGNLDSNKAITDDYTAYIQTLLPEEKKYTGPIQFFEDGTGQHAIQIQIALNGTWWFHDLIYDKDNKRVKTIKYSPGHYAS
jgi:hypothetical protein